MYVIPRVVLESIKAEQNKPKAQKIAEFKEKYAFWKMQHERCLACKDEARQNADSPHGEDKMCPSCVAGAQRLVMSP